MKSPDGAIDMNVLTQLSVQLFKGAVKLTDYIRIPVAGNAATESSLNCRSFCNHCVMLGVLHAVWHTDV